jgi:hypothetical protein
VTVSFRRKIQQRVVGGGEIVVSRHSAISFADRPKAKKQLKNFTSISDNSILATTLLIQNSVFPLFAYIGRRFPMAEPKAHSSRVAFITVSLAGLVIINLYR